MLRTRFFPRHFFCRGFLLSEQLVFSFDLIVGPSTYRKTQNNHNYRDFLAPDSSNKRNYCNQYFPEPRARRFTSYGEISHCPPSIYSNHFSYSQKVSTTGTYSVLQSSAFQHWFKNWQELRKHKLTASTFGGVVGFWPRRRVQLWQEKLGVIEPFMGNLATCWNNIKEEEALERYKLITGNSVLFPEFQLYGKKNPKDDWLAASPDGVIDQVIYGLPSRGVLEIKCPFFDGDMRRALPWSRIPLYFIPQAQGLLEILDRDWMDFYVWTINGSSLFRLHRNEEYWDLLKIALSDFWWNHVQPARELCNRSPIKDPITEMRAFKPAPRHELCASIVYASKYLVDDSKLLMREIHGKLQN